MLRPYTVPTVEEVLHPPQVPRSLLAHAGRKQQWPGDGHPCGDERLRHCNEGSSAPRGVADSVGLDSLAPRLDGTVHAAPVHRAEARWEHDGRADARRVVGPSPG